MALPKKIGTYRSDSNLTATVGSQIYGLSGNDSITGSDERDLIYGGNTEWMEMGLNPNYQGPYYKKVGDNDTIKAGGGDDVIFVGTGTDAIDGGSGYNQLSFYYGAPAEFRKLETGTGTAPKPVFAAYHGWLSRVSVDMMTGNYSGSFVDDTSTVQGSALGTFKHINSIVGSIGPDTINGDNGDNAFKPVKGADRVDGRGGFDIMSFDDLGTLGIVLTWGAGSVVDSFGFTDTFSNIEHVTGTKYADSMTGSVGEQSFTGLAGDDSINGLGGVDLVDYSREVGGNAINVLLASNTAKDTYGNTDTLELIERIKGTPLLDVITGDAENNEFWGFGAGDNLGGAEGDDTLWGGDGNDLMGGGDDNDELHGDKGHDTLTGGFGNDKFMGDAGNDVVKGAEGTDTLHGNDGDDKLDGQIGDDLLYGDDGDDTLIDAEVFDANAYVNGESSNSLFGGDGDDTLKGAGVLSGEDDNDRLSGIGTLKGGAGNDVLTGQSQGLSVPEYAYLIGGAGNDTLIDKLDNETAKFAYADYSYVKHSLTISLAKGSVTVGSGDVDTLKNIHGLVATGHDDLLSGTEDSDRIEGRGGDDLIKGGGGADVLEGGSGDDTLLGGGGSDGLSGEGGNDEIHTGGGLAGMDQVPGGVNGGAGKDLIYVEGDGRADWMQSIMGGAGNDTIVASGGFSEMQGGLGKDRFVFKAQKQTTTVDDFQHGEKIDLRDFNIASYAKLAQMMQDGPLGYYVELNLGGGVHLKLLGFHEVDLTKADFIL